MKVDWIPSKLSKTTGKLGLMGMPGYRKPLGTDLDALKAMDVKLIVCLQQHREFMQCHIPELEGEREIAVAERQIGFLHEPMADFSVPDVPQALRVVDRINAELDQGNAVAVHCFAGQGRAGTMAACVLVSRGYEPDEAVATVRKYRRGAVQTQAQYGFVRQFWGVDYR